MSHYKSNLRDIEFNLFEVLRRQDVMGAEPYEEFDEDTARGILDEVNRLDGGPLADAFTDADRNPPGRAPAGRPSPTCCGTSAPPSRRSSRCRPSSASGARPWC